MKLINVVVADSSPAVCRLIKSYLESAADIRVIGTAQQGQAMLELVEQQHPDVVTLGLEMPDMSGIEALKIMQQIRSTPAIVISSANTHGAVRTVEALHHGAVDFVFKFTPGKAIEPEALRQEIIEKVRIASHLNPASLVEATGTPQVAPGKLLTEITPQPAPVVQAVPEKVIVIGASTGGPIALRQLLSQLPMDFASSIIVVQHLPPSFTSVLAEQLHEQLPLSVKEAEESHLLQPGTVLITPGQFHLQVKPDGQLHLVQGTETDDYCPSINLTMQTVAEVYQSKARGVLLTGMGHDGLQGLAAIREHGGTTFVQTPETCTAPNLPRRAIAAGLADHVEAPDHIAELLLQGY